jgi:hypothetical protein
LVLKAILNGNRPAFHDEWMVQSGIIGFPVQVMFFECYIKKKKIIVISSGLQPRSG